MKVIQALIFSILVIASAAVRGTGQPLSMRELIIRIKFCQAKVNYFVLWKTVILWYQLNYVFRHAINVQKRSNMEEAVQNMLG